MAEKPDRFEDDERRKADLAPETDNSEQDGDADAQAQTVAADAFARSAGRGLGDSEKVVTGDDSDDVPDLIDRMKQMDSSGRIDMDAYRGEPNDDDDDEKFGEDAETDPKLRGDGS
jgi:hypothetical protein